MAHHTQDELCPMCAEKLTQAHESLRDWFTHKVKPSFPDAHISWSYRGKEDQEKAYSEGKTKLRFPNSPHNKMLLDKPYAHALDLFEIDDTYQAKFNPKFYFDVNELVRFHNDPIKWGGTFKTLSDKDHFELVSSG